MVSFEGGACVITRAAAVHANQSAWERCSREALATAVGCGTQRERAAGPTEDASFKEETPLMGGDRN